MDRYVTLAAPASEVFAHLADPARLGDWLPQIARVDPTAASVIGVGSTFTVTVRASGGEQDLEAEVTAHEPPWLIAYRLAVATSPVLIRATCIADTDGTRVHVEQTADTTPLLIDLTQLGRVVTGMRPDPR